MRCPHATQQRALASAAIAIQLTQTCTPDEIAQQKRGLLTLFASMAAEPHQASRKLWERYVKHAANMMGLDLEEVLELVPNLGQQGSLISDLSSSAGRAYSVYQCLVLVRRCLQDTVDPRQLLRQGLPQPQLPERHRLNENVVCVEVLAGLHLLLNCAKLWSGGVSRTAADLLPAVPLYLQKP